MESELESLYSFLMSILFQMHARYTYFRSILFFKIKQLTFRSIRHHFIRDAICNEHVKLAYLSTDKMCADILTNNLDVNKHCKFVNKITISRLSFDVAVVFFPNTKL